ncbi:MAG: DUF1207 domain-containing protein [Ignavibacteria bacterium]|nr:DUF1207 domain-containing protein [Ignavibacteria bacterium]
MHAFFFLLLIIFFSNITKSQTESNWFPSGINIQPFTANFLEPKAGFSYLLGREEIRLDIGTSADIFLHKSENRFLSFGADLFTYTRLRGRSSFHFPVETVDYLFGINSGFKIVDNEREYGLRFRFSHISAHLVDGAFDSRLNDWRNRRNPRTYSREFLELFPYYRINGLRFYLGFTYLVHVNPGFVGKGIYQFGFDYFADKLIADIATPFIAYDFKIMEIDKFFGNNIIEAGIKFGNYNSKGVSLILAYYSGKSIHGEYFNLNESYTTLGINVDL